MTERTSPPEFYEHADRPPRPAVRPASVPAERPAPAPLVVVRHAPFNAECAPAALTREVTPSASVYVRSNFDVPTLSHDDHRIVVGGAVLAPIEITAGELRRLPHTTATVTMECAGNDRAAMRPLPSGEPWGRGAVSTAVWTGVPLRHVLERAGLADEAVEVLVEGADRGTVDDAPTAVPFARSLPVTEAVRGDVLLATEMNGEPLTAAHGAPVRLVVPGWYGMASVKWVARIEVLARPFDGRFQTRRYVYDDADGVRPVTRMRVKSIITSPSAGEVDFASRITVGGWAWSGDGAITRVEVSAGGGEAWCDARLFAPASPHAWTRWELDWPVSRRGRYALRCRAHDAAGQVQPDSVPWNRLGYGNNAVQPVLVDVR